MHWAAHKHTAAEIVFFRADAEKDNMGLTSWEGKQIKKSDSEVAKNYLNNEELERKLQEEFMYYAEDLDELCHIIRKQLPRKMIYRIISKLYRLRGVK